MGLYKYYQKTGGKEGWKLVPADYDLSVEKPTFVTVLSLNTAAIDSMSKEEVQAVKYLGPLYFDIDSSDIDDALAGAKTLVGSLESYGLTEDDYQVYFSGKKGVHILVPPQVFMAKPAEVARLPAMYKVMAFDLATDCMDFKVYTAGMGRMFRTCYNVRENGLYRVQITRAQLFAATAETYPITCNAPGREWAGNPTYRTHFAMLFEQVKERVSKHKPKKAKPITQETLQQDSRVVVRVLRNQDLADVGFNKIAIQLAVWAREAGWSSDELVTQAQPLIQTHESDGRYNSAYKREQELRRMHEYVDDNPCYEYDVAYIRSLFKVEPKKQIVIVTNDVDTTTDEGTKTKYGIEECNGEYFIKKDNNEEETTRLANFVVRDFKSCIHLSSVTQEGSGIRTGYTGRAVSCLGESINFSIDIKTGVSATLAAGEFARCGVTYHGNDAQTRRFFEMLIERSPKTYVVDSEGVHLLRFPNVPELAEKSIPAWVDKYGVVMAPDREEELKKLMIDIRFQGYPTPEGVLSTDLSRAYNVGADAPNDSAFKESLLGFFQHFLKSHPPEIVGKLLGWVTATFWKPFFFTDNSPFAKFPLLHVYGAAGLGKTETVELLLRMFYLQKTPAEMSFSSSTFAIQQMICGTMSIPLLFDEYKPHQATRDKVESVRATLREMYNQKTIARGGGNKSRSDFGSLNVCPLSAPLVFVAEAIETETAIQGRSVIVPFRPRGPLEASENYAQATKAKTFMNVLPVLGKYIVRKVVMGESYKEFEQEFGKLLDQANGSFLTQPGDLEKMMSGELTPDLYKAKKSNTARPVYNIAVVLFGLDRLCKIVEEILGAEVFDKMLRPSFSKVKLAVLSTMLQVSKTVLPEYAKVLTTMSDMSRVSPEGSTTNLLQEGTDYDLIEVKGKHFLVLAIRAAFAKYRRYQKDLGTHALFPTDDSFYTAMEDTPFALGVGKGTTNLLMTTIWLDWEQMVEAGVPNFLGKFKTLETATYVPFEER